MPDYPRVQRALHEGSIDLADQGHLRQVSDYLVDQWVADYRRTCASANIVEVKLDRFSYLFDLKFERLISAWGLSPGATGHMRDKARMRGHPLGGDSSYHRGHAIPNQMAGGTDINLVAQKGAINVGPFREIEKKAVANPGSLYFTYWTYPAGNSQRPIRVQQGLILTGARVLQLVDFAN